MAVGYACALLSDAELAQDVAQDAFVAAFEGINQLRDPTAFPGWFRRIVYMRCTRYLRRPVREVLRSPVVARDLQRTLRRVHELHLGLRECTLGSVGLL